MKCLVILRGGGWTRTSECSATCCLQFNSGLIFLTFRCFQEVKAVLLKKRIEQKENVMAERRLVAEMERDRRTLTTKSECAAPARAFQPRCNFRAHFSPIALFASGTKRSTTCPGGQLKTKMLCDAFAAMLKLLYVGRRIRIAFGRPKALETSRLHRRLS